MSIGINESILIVINYYKGPAMAIERAPMRTLIAIKRMQTAIAGACLARCSATLAQSPLHAQERTP